MILDSELVDRFLVEYFTLTMVAVSFHEFLS